MARVNYSFEKRKRELDRKSKKAAKAEQRAKEGGSRANDGVPLEPLTGPVIPNYAEEDAKDEPTSRSADSPDQPPGPRALRGYCRDSATSGLTLAARRAGPQHAISDVAPRTPMAAAITSGSSAPTP